ncbi:MAG: hypothetical protein ACLR1P_04935 [Oscillospiraceae bacterium]
MSKITLLSGFVKELACLRLTPHGTRDILKGLGGRASACSFRHGAGGTAKAFSYVEGAGMHPHPMPFYIAAMGIILKEGTI